MSINYPTLSAAADLANFRHYRHLRRIWICSIITYFQIHSILTNKANLLDTQMNINLYIIGHYGIFRLCGCQKTNPIQTQLKPIQSQLKPIQTQFKPNQSQFTPGMATEKPMRKPLSLRYTPFANGRQESIICESVEYNLLRVPNKMNRSTENEHFRVWQGSRSRPSEDGRCSLTPSRHEISRLNAESFCYVLYS